MLWTLILSGVLILSLDYTLLPTRAQYVIDEESPVNTIIGNIAGKIPIIENAEFMLSQDSYFKISNKGDIALARTLDIESLCREMVKCCNKSKDCILDFLGMEKMSGKSFEFNVRVKDINDFKPVFSSDPIVLEVRENSNIGNTFLFDKALDGDFSSSNNQISYSLNPSSNVSNYFSLNDQSEPKLTIFKQLDYEQVQLLSGVITACDFNQQCTNVDLIVRVIDENDNEPNFQKASYDISINEDFPESSVVEQFIAIDKDSAENAKMKFWFDKASTDDETMEYFEIEKNTGKLFLVKPLSIKARSSFEFKVAVGETKASSSDQQYTDITHVKITIKDVNDNAPTIREFPMSDSIDENYKKLFLVAFSVLDNDEGDNARTKCELVTGKDSLEITEDEKPGTYKVIQKREFNAEAEEFILVDVICSDFGSPSMSTRKSWKIKINDKNEFEPKMTQAKYTAQVPENSPKGSHIIQISAEDRDRDSDLVYALDTVGQQYFNIDAQTGQIKAIGGQNDSMTLLDYEKMPKITFLVSATDYQDDKNYQTTSEVTVNLVDINDNVPRIEIVEPFKIHENVNGRNRIHGKIIAEDLDQGLNGKVHFKLENAWDRNGNSVNDRISVDSEGNIYALSMIDREEIPEIIVSLVACDEGSSLPNGKSFCSQSYNCTIEIIDENDNAPQWIYPEPNKKEALNLTTDYPIGSHVTFLRAMDPDASDNGHLTYELIDPLKQTVFIVNSSTGELLVNPNASTQNPLLAGRYELHLKVSDNGNPPRVSSSNLIISVATSEAMVNAQINFYIIIIMIILTSVISVCLIIAIVCVRRKPKSGLMGLGNSSRHSAALGPGQYNPRNCNDTHSAFYGSQLCYPIDGGQKTSIYKHETSPTSGLVDYEPSCLDSQYGQLINSNYYNNATGTLGSSYNPKQQLYITPQQTHCLADINPQGSLTRTSTPGEESHLTNRPQPTSSQQMNSIVDGAMISTFGHPMQSKPLRNDTVCLSSTGYRQISPGTLLFSPAQMGNASPMGPIQIVDHIDGDSADSGRGASEDDHHNLQQHSLQHHHLLNMRSNSPNSMRFVQNPTHLYKFGSMNKNSLLRQYPNDQMINFPDSYDVDKKCYQKLPQNIQPNVDEIMKEDRV